MTKKLYFMGIGGTGMAAVAGLCKAAGYNICGSDQGVYPPMSTMLDELEIPYHQGYDKANLESEKPDTIVVANALSRGNEEVEYMLDRNLSYTSFPKLMGEHFLSKKTSIVVCGTHGKTTTSSLMSYFLHKLDEDPSFLIGGIPKDFPRSFQLGSGKHFVIEGDEYDTAFFDKKSKFLHYHPDYLIFNNLEYDHADIFKDLESIEVLFEELIKMIEDKSKIIANASDSGVVNLLKKMDLEDQVTWFGIGESNPVNTSGKILPIHDSNQLSGHFHYGDQAPILVKTDLTGQHNLSNLAATLTTLHKMSEDGCLKFPLNSEKLLDASLSFKGVARRMDELVFNKKVSVFEDFAHHPTSVKLVIQGFRALHPEKRVLVAFEPRNATSRRNTFEEQYSQSLSEGDRVYIGACPVDTRIDKNERMDTNRLAKKIGTKAQAFHNNDDLLIALKQEAAEGDAIIFMSSGSFSGIQYAFADFIKNS